MKKVLWISRHDPLPSQMDELKRLFGDVLVVKDPKPFSSAEDIYNRFKSGGYDEAVVVAPLSVIAKLTELGMRPLWADMKLVGPDEPCEVEANGRRYVFQRFRRIRGIVIQFEDLEKQNQ